MIYRYHKSGDGQQLSEQTRKAFTRKNIHELSSKNETFVALVVTLGGTVNYVSEILGTHKGSTCNIEKPHLVGVFFFANKLSVKRFTSIVALYMLNWANTRLTLLPNEI